MARSTTKAKPAKGKGKTAGKSQSNGTVSGIERVFNRETLLPNWEAFSEYVVEHGGPEIDPEHVGIVLTGYKYFQKSDAAVASREAAQEARAAAKAERDEKREAQRQEREASKEKAATKKSTSKSAAAASKPTPTARRGKTAVKKTAAKKTTAKKTASKKAPY